LLAVEVVAEDQLAYLLEVVEVLVATLKYILPQPHPHTLM
jgi:hypothetical protein